VHLEYLPPCPPSGVLRSFDQFANLVLESTVERVFVGEQYGDIPLGLQLIRGENVVLLGEIDPSRPAPEGFTQTNPAEIMQAQRAEKQLNKLKATIRCAFVVRAQLTLALVCCRLVLVPDLHAQKQHGARSCTRTFGLHVPQAITGLHKYVM